MSVYDLCENFVSLCLCGEIGFDSCGLEGVGFPDGDVLLESVHERGEQGERFGAVFGVHGDVDGGFAHADDADAVLHADGEARVRDREFGEKAVHHGLGHGLVGFIDERGDGLAVFLAAHGAGKLGDRADARGRR